MAGGCEASRAARSEAGPGRASPARPGARAQPSRRLALAGLLLLPACGFAPAYAPGGSGERLRGRVAVEAPDTPDGFVLGARLEDRLGRPDGAAPLRLLLDLSVEEVSAAVTPGGAITRYDLVGRAPWRLLDAGGAVVADGEASAFTGYSATGTTVATTAAEADARGRLMALLADAVVTRLLLLPPSALPAGVSH